MHKSWIEGPRELLQHAHKHMQSPDDFDNRIAFISIDNAVELAIRTFLSLPKRILKREGPSRKKLGEAENSFPTQLDLLEEYASDLLTEVDLEDIEWYHRMRNQLYHNGNCLTIGLSKVEAYFEIGASLFEKLFDEKFDRDNAFEYQTMYGIFFHKWFLFESSIKEKLRPPPGEPMHKWIKLFADRLQPGDAVIFRDVFTTRNELAHYPLADQSSVNFTELLAKLDHLQNVWADIAGQ